MKVKVEVKGDVQLREALNLLGKNATPSLGMALYVKGEQIMAKAKELTPVDTGNLRASGHVTLPRIGPHKAEVELGFGGSAGATVGGKYVGYALYVHENLSAKHKVGQAKFLEAPFVDATSDLEAWLARYLKIVLLGSA